MKIWKMQFLFLREFRKWTFCFNVFKNRILRNKRKHATVALSVFVTLLTVNVTLAQPHLNPYLQLAAENNPSLKAKFAAYHAALEKIPQVSTLPDPQLAFSYFVLPVETRLGPQQAKGSFSQQFPWFGTLKTNKSVAAGMAKVKLQQFEEAKARLFFEVKNTYFNIYLLEEAIEITEDNLLFVRSLRDLALVKFEVGKAGMVDVLRTDMEILEMENQLALLKDNRQPLIAKFEELLNTSILGPVNLPDSLPTDTLIAGKSELLDSMVASNPSVLQFDYKIKAYENQAQAARKKGAPSFRIGVEYMNMAIRTDADPPENGRDALMLPMVGVRLPVYRSKYKAMQREANFLEEAAGFEKEATENALTTKLEMAFRDYFDAQRRLNLNRQLHKISKQTLDLLTTDYSTAGKNFEELLRMERMILKYSLEIEKARVDFNVAKTVIEWHASLNNNF